MTVATVVSLPVNNDYSDKERIRLSSQLCSLKENIVFKKLGVYGRRKPRKLLANVVEPISLPVKPNDEVLLTMLPDLPKLATVNSNTVDPNQSPPPSSTNNR